MKKSSSMGKYNLKNHSKGKIFNDYLKQKKYAEDSKKANGYHSAGVINIANIKDDYEELHYSDRSERPRASLTKPHYNSFANLKQLTIPLTLIGGKSQTVVKDRCIESLTAVYNQEIIHVPLPLLSSRKPCKP